ncbi:MAG TPA: hypothetical protein VK446_13435 [Methylocystis sp.]|nr:hypothetical protein [Methylocystis sp.]
MLNAHSPHNAKVRDALLDVKRIRMTAPTGLELWDVALKRGFPLPALTISCFFAALDLAPPMMRRRSYALDEFLAEVIGPDSAFRTIKTTKERRQFFLGGCRAELVRLCFGGLAQETFCVEDESPDRVEAAVRELGLDPGANTNFPKFFKRFMAMQA